MTFIFSTNPSLPLILLALIFFGECGIVPEKSSDQTRQFKAFVLHVSDGDSFVGRTSSGKSVTIRLHAIDAPEKGQAGSTASRKALTGLIKDKHVIINSVTRDRFGRIVAIVLYNDSDIGLEMIKRGNAWHFKAFAEEQSFADQMSYASAERSARETRSGIWRSNSAVPPWEFRKQKINIKK